MDRIETTTSDGFPVATLWPDPLPGRKSPSVDEEVGLGPLRETHALFMIRNVPDEETVAAVLAFRPDAADLLRWWSEAWRRNEAFLKRPVGFWVNESEDRMARTIARRELHTADEFASRGRGALDAEEVGLLSEHYVRHLRADAVAAGQRDWRLHVIDDALLIRSISRTASPLWATVLLGDRSLTFVGNDGDGYPRFVRQDELPSLFGQLVRMRIAGFLDDRVPYWEYRGFRSNAGRDMAVAHGHPAAAVLLAAMSRQGHVRAFVKGLRTKSGTWTVNVAGADTPSAAHGRLAEAIFPDDPGSGFLVQEHLPFLREQRFFVVDGRIVCSVCSDRELCGLDVLDPRRILDERVAVLHSPEVGKGVFDRGRTTYVVSRDESARLAWAARRIVQELRKEGLRRYVLDLGVSERGIHAIELNSVEQSGPYALDRDRLLRAFERGREARVLRGPTSVMARILLEGVVTLANGLPSRSDEVAGPRREGDLLEVGKDPLDRLILASVRDGVPLAGATFRRDSIGRPSSSGRIVVFRQGRSIVAAAAFMEAQGVVTVQPLPLAEHAELPFTNALPVFLNRMIDDGRSVLFDDGRTKATLHLEPIGAGSRVTIRLEEGDAVLQEISHEIDVPAVRANAMLLLDAVRGRTTASWTRVARESAATWTFVAKPAAPDEAVDPGK